MCPIICSFFLNIKEWSWKFTGVAGCLYSCLIILRRAWPLLWQYDSKHEREGGCRNQRMEEKRYKTMKGSEESLSRISRLQWFYYYIMKIGSWEIFEAGCSTRKFVKLNHVPTRLLPIILCVSIDLLWTVHHELHYEACTNMDLINSTWKRKDLA